MSYFIRYGLICLAHFLYFSYLKVRRYIQGSSKYHEIFGIEQGITLYDYTPTVKNISVLSLALITKRFLASSGVAIRTTTSQTLHMVRKKLKSQEK